MSRALKVAGVLSGAAITGVATIAAPAGASTSITWMSTYHSGKYLGIYQNSTKDGAYANIFAWVNEANQKWTAIDVGNSDEWAFVNQNSGKCLEDHAYQKSGYVDQWDCGSYGANTRFDEDYNPFGNEPPSDSYALINQGNGASACPTSANWVIWESNPTTCLWR